MSKYDSIMKNVWSKVDGREQYFVDCDGGYFVNVDATSDEMIDVYIVRCDRDGNPEGFRSIAQYWRTFDGSWERTWFDEYDREVDATFASFGSAMRSAKVAAGKRAHFLKRMVIMDRVHVVV